MRRLQVLAVAMLSLALSAAASPAFAAARAPGCSVSIFQDATSLPSNAPALILNDTSHAATATVSAELVSSDGRVALVGPTKDTHGLTVLRFASPSVGAHTIAIKVGCSTGRDESFETPIALTAPVPFPKSVGSLTVVPSSPPKGVDEIVLEASPELRAFFPVSVMKLIVNDDARSVTGGYPQAAGATSVRFRAHTGSVCVENGSLLRDKRIAKITVSADIAGLAESPAPTVLEVPVDCGAIKWTSDYDYKSVTNGTDSTTPTQTPGTSDNASVTTGGTDGGCSAAPSGVGSGNAAALVAGALAVLAGLRRRRRAA